LSKPSIIIVGAGGHALSCIDVIEQENKYEILGLIGLEDEVGSTRSGYEVIGTDTELKKILASCENAFNAVGQIKNPLIRIKIYESLTKIGFSLPTIISPKAYVSSKAKLGIASIVLHGATVNSTAIVGNNTIINSHALIEHGVTVGDHCHISTGVVINGDVSIGSRTFIGSGSVIKQDISIGADSFVKMGTVVIKSIEGYL
jgi:sugar O-acyltransferase (sialic acid O-acetyltransferase NeuD family)